MGNTASGTPRFRIGIGLALALLAAVALAPSATTPAFTAQVRHLHANDCTGTGASAIEAQRARADCLLRHPEQPGEMVARVSQWGARNAAPFSQIAEGAQENAIQESGQLPVASAGSWTP